MPTTFQENHMSFRSVVPALLPAALSLVALNCAAALVLPGKAAGTARRLVMQPGEKVGF